MRKEKKRKTYFCKKKAKVETSEFIPRRCGRNPTKDPPTHHH
jgi:hypothetical protein